MIAPSSLQFSADGTVRPWATELIELAPDVYAYVQARGEAGISNAGAIAGPRGVTIVDTLATAPMAKSFLALLRQRTSLPVERTLFTHHHIDHVIGAQFFSRSPIIAQERCRDAMAESGVDAHRRWAIRRPQFAEGLKDVEDLVLPDVTFDSRMTFRIGERIVEFVHLGGTAHTVGDAVVYLPAERILFAGDLLFYGVFPTAFQGVVGRWIEVANELLTWDFDVIVPGHGPLSDKRGFAMMRDCLVSTYEQCRRFFNAGVSEGEAIARLDTGVCGSWAEREERVAANVLRCYAEFRGELMT
jgi:cyclase